MCRSVKDQRRIRPAFFMPIHVQHSGSVIMRTVIIMVIVAVAAFAVFKAKKADAPAPAVPPAMSAPAASALVSPAAPADPIGAAAAARLQAPLDAAKSAVDTISAPRNRDPDVPSKSSTEGVTAVGAPKQ